MLTRRSENCISCESCNERSPLFRLLNNEELKVMNANRFEVVFNTGEMMVKQGTSATHLVMITKGMAKLYLEGYDKKNLILELVTPWKLFGGPGLFTDYRYHYSVSAIEETSACFISIENVRKVIRTNPDFAESLLRHCSLNGANNFTRLISLTQKQMPGRLADVLLSLSADIYKSNSFQLSLTRQEIGDMSNMTKESATRIMKEFEHEGIIKIDGKHLELLKPDKLKDISLHG